MGIVSDKDFESESSKLSNTADNLGRKNSNNKSTETVPTTNQSNESNPITGQIVDVTRGRPSGAIETPNSVRKLIGEETITNGRQSALELAAMLGVSPSSVSAYSHGSTSTASYDEQPNVGHINHFKEKISIRARSKLMKALRHITEEKLKDAPLKIVASVARDMSAVVKNMEQEGPKTPNNGPTFVFYSPQIRKEDSFDIILSKE